MLAVCGPLKVTEGFDKDALDRVPNADAVLPYVTYFLFHCVHYGVLNYDMCIHGLGMNESVNYHLIFLSVTSWLKSLPKDANSNADDLGVTRKVVDILQSI